MTIEQFNAAAAQVLGGTTMLFFGTTMLAAWRLRKVRRARLGERTAPAGLAANTLELTAEERYRLNRDFDRTIRGVQR